MSIINEIINRQALAVKAGSNAIKAAEALELAAKLLRADAAKPIKLDFSVIVKEKKSRLEKFASAIKKDKQDKAHQLLTTAGYLKGMQTVSGISTYGHKSKPGTILRISGESFSVHYHADVKVAPLPLRELQAYLEINKIK